MQNIESFPELEVINNVIIFGGNLFLYQKDRAQRQMQVLMGNKKIPAHAIDNYHTNLDYNLSIAKRDGFDYLHVVFPCKPIIYREQFKDIGLHLTPIFLNEHAHPKVLYPIESLLESDYFPTDSHYNTDGAMKVLDLILEKLGYPALPEAVYKPASFVGDLSRMIGQHKEEVFKKLSGFKFLPDTDIKNHFVSHGIMGKSNAGVFTYRFNPYALFNKRVVLFGDSFFLDKIEVYQNTFSEVVYFRIPYILDDVVKSLQPDIVITANTERYLYNVPNVLKAKPWFLHYLSSKYDPKRISEESRRGIDVLFSGRDSAQYLNSFGNKLTDMPREVDKLKNLVSSDIRSSADVSFLKDMANTLKNEDPELSLHLINLVQNNITGV